MGFFNDFVAAFKKSWNEGRNNDKCSKYKFGDVEEQEEELEEIEQPEESKLPIEWPDFIVPPSLDSNIYKGKSIQRIVLEWNTTIRDNAEKEYIIRADDENLDQEILKLVNADDTIMKFQLPPFTTNILIYTRYYSYSK